MFFAISVFKYINFFFSFSPVATDSLSAFTGEINKDLFYITTGLIVCIILYCKDTNIIFKRYVRENISLGGHGIGLSIVKDICDKYKIKIDVTSQENHNIFSYRLNCHTNITSKG